MTNSSMIANTNLPPGPSCSIAEQHFRWYTKPYQFMQECANQYGDSFTVRFGSGEGNYPIVFISDPAYIEAIFSADPNLLLSGIGNKLISIFLGEYSLLTLDGPKHQIHRRLIAPPLHGERMRALSSTMLSIAANAFKNIDNGESFSVRRWIQNLSLSIIMRTVLGVDEEQLNPDLNKMLTHVLHGSMSLPGYLHTITPSLRRDLGQFSWWGRYERQRKFVDQTIYAQIRSCQGGRADERNDLLALMASITDVDGQGLSNQEIRDEVLTLLVAGHETTAAALSWALYWIHRTAHVKERLLGELRPLKNSIKECSQSTSVDTTFLTRLPYLNAVIQETLRITPPVPITFMRFATEKIKLLDYEFGPNINLLPCIYLTHHRSSIYENPEEFRPERFLENEFSQYEFFPFGGGVRKCIGASFAMQEMKLVLAMIFSNFELKVESPKAVEPTRRGIAVTVPDSYRLVKVRSL